MKTLQCVYQHETTFASRTWLTQPIGDGVIREISWKEALDETRRIAAYLRDLGYPPGSRIAILSKNCAWWFMADLESGWPAMCRSRSIRR